MKRFFSALTVLMVACLFSVATAKTIKCKGTVVDGGNEPIAGATVSIDGGRALGATDVDGRFAVDAPDNARLAFSFVGFKKETAPAASNMGTIVLSEDGVMLNDVIVTQSLARTRETPVALSQVNANDIEFKLGTQEFPEILKTTPGVWTTKDGGGFGDAKTNMRGFKSNNVAVLVNGIPINDMEWGGVYWSNWAGLSDVASNIQTQRGLGAALLAAPSVGGTINITTQGLDAKRGGSVWYGMGNDGMNQIGVKVSTGLMKNGWAVTLLGSRRWGDGYVQGTWFNSYNYFLNISKRINDAHQLSLTAFGAPQTHNKRSSQDGLTIMGWQEYGERYMDGESPYRYNPTWGYGLDGQRRSSNLNHYHKPQISLNHIWQIDEKSSLSTTFYMSFARGGGYKGLYRDVEYNGSKITSSSWYGVSDGKLLTQFRNADGTFGYNQIQLMNQQSQTGSNMVMADNINSHNWYGLVSTYKNSFLDDKLKFTGGLDLRYYKAEHYAKIIDLYDGEYFMDDVYRSRVKAINRPGLNQTNLEWVYEKLGVGDKVYRDYDGYTHNEGIFLQGEYTTLEKKLNIVVSGSASNTGYKLYNKYYYDEANGKTDWHNFFGGTIKGGANYNIDRHNNVFVNLGYISRAPYFSAGVFLYPERSVAVNSRPKNEKIMSFELGYGFHSKTFSLDFNAYYSKWFDKVTTRSLDLTGDMAGQTGSFVMNGVNARHMGLELAAVYRPATWVKLDAMISIGDFAWASNPTGYVYGPDGTPLAALNGTPASGVGAEDHLKSRLMQKDVKVGGTAQTTGSISATFYPWKGWRIGADWTFNTNNYSDYVVSGSSFTPGKDITVKDPWKIPWGQQFDLSASYGFKIGGVDARLSGNVNNLFNYNYVVDAYNTTGVKGEWDNVFRVFYSFGRTYSLKLRVNF